MNEVIEMQPSALAAPVTQAAPATPADIVLYAMQKGADIAQIEKFMDLQIRWEADQARKAFVSDMAEFKKNPPEIVKDKQVAYSGTNYMHATLGNVTEAIVAGLAAHGFSHRWSIDQQKDGAITVTCILTHKLGHSESTPMSASKDDSGKKNQIQQVASTITYLQRYTLLAATGVATKDQGDDDGRGAEHIEPSPKREPKPAINGKEFAAAVAAIKAGEYSIVDMRSYYALMVDQETMLNDLEKELAK